MPIDYHLITTIIFSVVVYDIIVSSRECANYLSAGFRQSPSNSAP